MVEEWRAVPGHEVYEVSNLGRVRTVRYLRKRRDRGGYLRIALSKDGSFRQVAVHRLVAELFIGNPDGKPEVNHKDGDKDNNGVANLEWSTPSENRLHAFRTGLREPQRGEDHPRAKLRDADVIEIRKQMARGANGMELARRFGVSRSTIEFVKVGRSWAHIAQPLPPSKDSDNHG